MCGSDSSLADACSLSSTPVGLVGVDASLSVVREQAVLHPRRTSAPLHTVQLFFLELLVVGPTLRDRASANASRHLLPRREVLQRQQKFLVLLRTPHAHIELALRSHRLPLLLPLSRWHSLCQSAHVAAEDTSPDQHAHVNPVSNEPLVSYLWLSPSKFRLCWWLIELVHLVCAVFALIASAVHTLLAIPAVYVNNSLIAIPREILILSAWSYLGIGLLHVGAFVLDVSRSLRSCRLTFGYDVSVVSPTAIGSRSRVAIFNQRLVDSATKLVAVPVSLWQKYFAINGLFGAHGSHFVVGFHIRQLVEIMLQTYQAYQISRSVPRVWILNCVVVMLVVNGITMPVVFALFHKKSRVTRRTMVLVVDLLVDLVISVVVPLAIVVPRLIPFDIAIGGYPQELIYDDVWITMAVSEARQVLVTSKLDFVSSLLPFVLALFGLDTIKTLVRRQPRTSQKLHPTPMTAQILETMAVGVSDPYHGPRIQGGSRRIVVTSEVAAPTVFPQATAGTLNAAPSSKQGISSRLKSKKAAFLGHVAYLTATWTLCAVSVHICSWARQSNSQATDTLCALHMNSWIARLTPCAVARLSCHQLQTTGADSVLQDALAKLDRRALARLVISHCPDLHVPSIVTEFSDLRGFMTFNCTLSSWPKAAALTSSSTPLVVTTHFIDTNFSTDGLPDGIYHSLLPIGTNFLLYRSNLTKLPENIDQVWGSRKWTSFWIENSPLRDLPPSFADLNVVKLAIMGTQIASLDDNIFAKQSLTWVRLSRNPITTLPSSLCDAPSGSTLTHLLLQNTSAMELTPLVRAWLDQKRQQRQLRSCVVSFFGSPICENPAYDHFCDPLNPLLRDDYRYDIVAPQRPL